VGARGSTPLFSFFFAGRSAPPQQANFTGESEPSPRVDLDIPIQMRPTCVFFFSHGSVSASGAPARQARCKTCLVLWVQGREVLDEPGDHCTDQALPRVE
jgi:hypothetical protein